MSNRFMRVIVFFDLPTLTVLDRKEYIRFRKFLLKQGFIMMQESVYSKIAMNGTSANLIKERVRKETPNDGLVQMLSITEKQFASMEYLVGKPQKTIVESTDRMVIL